MMKRARDLAAMPLISGPPRNEPPPVPPDADLRDFDYMPLEVRRLRDSDLSGADAEGFRLAVLLWCAAWHQVPAGSLPNDARMVAHLAGFGRDVRALMSSWRRGGASGWQLYTDGRLYHGVVAEKVRGALGRSQSAKRSALTRWNSSKAEMRTHQAETCERNATPQCVGNARARVGREGKGREETLSPIESLFPESTHRHPASPHDDASPKRKPDPMQGFDDFWREYPRKVGKGAARRAWPKAVAACDGDAGFIVAAVKTQRQLGRFDLREEGRFVPHPATWLNAERWSDHAEDSAP